MGRASDGERSASPTRRHLVQRRSVQIQAISPVAGFSLPLSLDVKAWPTPLQRGTISPQVHLDIMMLRCHTPVMRTTLHLDDDVYEAERSLAAIDRSSVGKILSRLARRALNPARPATSSKGFPVFDVPPDARPLTPDRVRDALDET